MSKNEGVSNQSRREFLSWPLMKRGERRSEPLEISKRVGDRYLLEWRRGVVDGANPEILAAISRDELERLQPSDKLNDADLPKSRMVMERTKIVDYLSLKDKESMGRFKRNLFKLWYLGLISFRDVNNQDLDAVLAGLSELAIKIVKIINEDDHRFTNLHLSDVVDSLFTSSLEGEGGRFTVGSGIELTLAILAYFKDKLGYDQAFAIDINHPLLLLQENKIGSQSLDSLSSALVRGDSSQGESIRNLHVSLVDVDTLNSDTPVLEDRIHQLALERRMAFLKHYKEKNKSGDPGDYGKEPDWLKPLLSIGFPLVGGNRTGKPKPIGLGIIQTHHDGKHRGKGGSDLWGMEDHQNNLEPRGITRRSFLRLMSISALSVSMLSVFGGSAVLARPEVAYNLAIGEEAKELAFDGFIDLLKDVALFLERSRIGVDSGVTLYAQSGSRVKVEIGRINESFFIKLDELPPLLKNTLVLLEDKDFYEHDGIQIKTIMKRLFLNRGGTSTLTMQLVEQLQRKKMGDDAYERLMAVRGAEAVKKTEVVSALMLEAYLRFYFSNSNTNLNEEELNRLVKETILNIYFNEVRFGTADFARGIKNSILTYTSVENLSDLNEREQLAFALLANQPGLFMPGFEFRAANDSLYDRDSYINVIAKYLLDEGRLDETTYNKILSQELEHLRFKKDDDGNLMVDPQPPYFNLDRRLSDPVYRDYLNYVNFIVGDNGVGLELDRLVDGRVELSVNEHIQRMLYEIKKDAEKEHEGWEVNIIVKNARTGDVLGYVGGLYNIQPGSIAKIPLYHEVFQLGFDGDTPLTDEKFNVLIQHLVVNDDGSQSVILSPWCVVNDASIEFGRRPIKEMLAQSCNRAAAKLALFLGTVPTNLAFQKFGLMDGLSNSPQDMALANVLGPFGTSIGRLSTLAQAIYNDGEIVPPTVIEKVSASNSKTGVIYQAKRGGRQQIGSELAMRQIKQALSDPNNVPNVPYWQPFTDQSIRHFGKTGTSDPLEIEGGILQHANFIGGTLGLMHPPNENGATSNKDIVLAVSIRSTDRNGVSGLLDAAPIGMEVMKRYKLLMDKKLI